MLKLQCSNDKANNSGDNTWTGSVTNWTDIEGSEQIVIVASTFLSIDCGGTSGPITSGVSSFNGRTGAVTSQAGDYSANQITYNNIPSGIPAANVQAAIDYLAGLSATSASPGFSFGRAGIVNSGTYLQCETVPSNVAGRWVFINSAVVEEVFVSNELSTTFSLDFYYHDGNSINETLLGTVTVTAAYGNRFAVNWAVPSNKQLSAKISSNSAKNVVCGLSLRGTI
jgi:hypothetical protein